VSERLWNPRYLAYAKSNGVDDPAQMIASDEERFPGGKMTGFIVWIGRQWERFRAQTGRRHCGPASRDYPPGGGPDEQAAFDAWLQQEGTT
jgi:hypothetical protein